MTNRQTFYMGLVMGLLLGGGVLLFLFRSPEVAYAADDVGGSRYAIVAGTLQGGKLGIILADPESKRILIYESDNSSSLRLTAARNISWDLMAHQWGKTEPKVSEMKKGAEEAAEKAAEKGEGLK